MRIKYRMANDGDVDAMADFWSKNSEWDIIDRIEWEKRFVHTPFGRAVVALGIDEESGEIIGQFIFIPVDIVVKGIEKKAYRPFAPILQKALQTRFGIASLLTGQHPLLKMYKIIANQLTKEGIAMIYMIPDPRWSRVLQAFPFIHTHRFPLYTRVAVTNDEHIFPDTITTSKISPCDTEIDMLWEECATVYSCSIIRNSKTLPWKTSHGHYKIYIVKRNDRAIGLFVLIYKQKDQQWLICDLLAIDKNESLDIILQAACSTVQKEIKTSQLANDQAAKIAILATPAIEEVARRHGFEKNDYHFTLAVHVLNKDDVDKKDISPENWYISAND